MSTVKIKHGPPPDEDLLNQTLEDFGNEKAQFLQPDAAEETDVEEQRFSIEWRKPSFPVSLMMPFIDSIRGPVVASMLYYAKHLDIGFELVGNTLLASARNELAMRFLRSTAEWSFWLDSDVFIPYGKADTFLMYTAAKKLPPQFAANNALVRMLAHKQPLVGGVYASRTKRSVLVVQPELEPRNPNDTRVCEALREGKSAGGLQPVDWVAAGLMLVHRVVFETIMQEQPVELPHPNAHYPFFTQMGLKGEDVAFCDRARAAGFQPLLDTEIRAGHIGPTMFMPEDTVSMVRGRSDANRVVATAQ